MTAAVLASACGTAGSPGGTHSSEPYATAASGSSVSEPSETLASNGGPTSITTDPAPPNQPQAAPMAQVALVPVVAYWSSQRSITRDDVKRLLAGQPAVEGPSYSTVALSAADAKEIAASFGIALASDVRLVSPAGIAAAVHSSPTTLGLMRADEVTPDLRALAVDGASLFGSGHVKDAASWPLNFASSSPSSFDPGREWTLTAGGDVNLDRSVFVESITDGKGVDYPWDGGVAQIAGTSCCGFQGASLVVARRSGSPGAFRALLSGSDISIVNLEGPASVNFVHRVDGFVFAVDPELLAGIKDAGIDAVSLANNHIRNTGNEGVIESCTKLDSLGIGHAGAGVDLATASAPVALSAGGLKVAFLAFDAQQPANWVGPGRAGAAPLVISAVTADIRAARAAGANFVIVMPHWGVEYSEYVSPLQRSEAAAMVAAGADVVLGAHSHVAGGMQVISKPSGDPALVVYSLGNLLFDFNHDEATQEGVVDDLTFVGTQLVQADLHPTVMVDHSQVNLLDPAGAKRVLDRIRAASGPYLTW